MVFVYNILTCTLTNPLPPVPSSGPFRVSLGFTTRDGRVLTFVPDEFQMLYQPQVLVGRAGREPGGCQEPDADVEVTAEAPGPPLSL